MERTEQLVAANGKLEREVAERTRQQEHRALLEAQLLQAQKLEAVGRLAGGVAHDFNNLLTVILGYLEKSVSRTDVPDDLLAELTEVQDAAHTAASLTRQLLALSRKEVRRPVALDLNMHLRRLEKMLRRVIGERVKVRSA